MWHFISSIIFSRILQIWNVGTNNRATRLEKLLHVWLRWQQIFYSFYHLLKKMRNCDTLQRWQTISQRHVYFWQEKNKLKKREPSFHYFVFESKNIHLPNYFLCSYCRQQKSLLKISKLKRKCLSSSCCSLLLLLLFTIRKSPRKYKENWKNNPLNAFAYLSCRHSCIVSLPRSFTCLPLPVRGYNPIICCLVIYLTLQSWPWLARANDKWEKTNQSKERHRNR